MLISLAAYRIAGYSEFTPSGKVFCSYSFSFIAREETSYAIVEQTFQSPIEMNIYFTHSRLRNDTLRNFTKDFFLVTASNSILSDEVSTV